MFFALAMALFHSTTHAQDQATAESATGDFFSGTVVTFNSNQITVYRKGVGKDTAATRTFDITPATKIEGSLRPKARVTVRFMPTEGTAAAVHIIAR